MADLYIGLMSGTSMDGVDAALCEFDDNRFTRIVATGHAGYSDDLRARLLRLQREAPALTLAECCELDNAVAERFAQAASAALGSAGLDSGSIRAIGSHGQTVFHDPEGVRSSLQLGNPSLIAAVTGIVAVGDFRRADIALGGHGAPLVPAFHHALFASDEEPRCIINIGGIANITILPDADRASVRGFDTGPGNGLMDEWAELHLHERFDAEGRFAAGGEVHAPLLQALLGDPWFARAPPKSTGRQQLNLAWVQQRYTGLGLLLPADVQRTFCELTARSIAQAIRRHAPETRRALPCGGGTLNAFLIECLSRELDGITLDTPARYGVDAQWMEACAFAWLAMRTMSGLPGNLPGVTGASREAVLGGIYRA